MGNVEIVRNTPSSSMLEAARETAEKNGYERGSQFTLYVNGWLVDSRGMDTLARAIDDLDGQVDILMAGVAEGECAEYLASHEDVEFLGRVEPEKALALYWRAHLVLTFYDPTIEINRLAESNKWGDCIATGTPFVVNDEVKTARPYVERGACFSCPYSDDESLAQMLLDLSADSNRWKQVQKALRTFDQEPWDNRMRQVISKFL
jgi:glycosyltransferase involved in cell wall biosynthesis